MVVRLYRVDSGFQNVCDGISVRKPGSDAIYTEAVYELPDGYTLDVDDCGYPKIYDPKGYEATPCIRSNRPSAAIFLATIDGGMVPVKKAESMAKHIPLRDARIAAGMTQRQLALASGVNQRQIQKVEAGEIKAGNMTASNLLAIADALGVDPRVLIPDEKSNKCDQQKQEEFK
ncbi:MAG: helix-turn-helix transcriptional regulator [Elusimicrobiales bacterium]|nr:helix-turn-helix transcriptional regulator [Elusimicrobiales bacterium]